MQLINDQQFESKVLFSSALPYDLRKSLRNKVWNVFLKVLKYLQT